LSEFRGPLPVLNSFAAVQTYIRDEAKKTPLGQWIVVPRTFPTRLKEMRMPTRDVLDVDTEHPVMFDASYVAVANSYALKISGITRDTPNPPGGVIVKDERGEPNGILRNAQFLLKGVSHAENFTAAEKEQALQQQLSRYVAAGYTSIIDRIVNPESIAIYRKLKAENRLPLRAALTWWLDINRPQADLIAEINSAGYKTGDGDHWLRFASFKVNIDGGMTIGTAYQRQPYGPFGRQLYGQTDPTNRGQRFATPEKFLSVFRAARDRGWQLSAHSQGGGAVDTFLDAMEALNQEKPIGPTRSHLIHASFQSRDAIEKAKQLGILVDVQAPWLFLDCPALLKVFGTDGLGLFYPLRSYINAGILLAAGTDHMVGHDKNHATNPYNPFLNMWVAITRKMSDGQVLHPEQRITREEALKMYTIWPAYFEFEEKEKGSIEAGKLADLVVIDRDYLTCPEDQIREIEPTTVVIEGRVAYSQPSH
jgi:predicted amidohydrolase YtcJ